MQRSLEKFLELCEELSKEMWDRSDRKGVGLAWLENLDDAILEIRTLQEKNSEWGRVVAAVLHTSPGGTISEREWTKTIKEFAGDIPERLRPRPLSERSQSVASKMSGLVAWAGRRPPT